MSKMSKAVAVLGVVAGLGVAALPLSSYAATSQRVNINAEIDSTISLSAEKQDLNIKVLNGGDLDTSATDGSKGYATTNLTVTANGGGYKVTVKSADGTAKLTAGDDATAIPYGAPAANTSAWGMTINNGTDWIDGLADGEVEVKTGTVTAGEDGKATDTFPVGFGVTAKADQKAGVYEGAVIFTAAANGTSTGSGS